MASEEDTGAQFWFCLVMIVICSSVIIGAHGCIKTEGIIRKHVESETKFFLSSEDAYQCKKLVTSEY